MLKWHRGTGAAQDGMVPPYCIEIEYVSHGHMKLQGWSSVFANTANVPPFPGKGAMCSEGETKQLEQ